nr:alpha-(1,3)-fucosyltransferase fut-3-like [Lytechinus pictus]
MISLVAIVYALETMYLMTTQSDHHVKRLVWRHRDTASDSGLSKESLLNLGNLGEDQGIFQNIRRRSDSVEKEHRDPCQSIRPIQSPIEFKDYIDTINIHPPDRNEVNSRMNKKPRRNASSEKETQVNGSFYKSTRNTEENSPKPINDSLRKERVVIRGRRYYKNLIRSIKRLSTDHQESGTNVSFGSKLGEGMNIVNNKSKTSMESKKDYGLRKHINQGLNASLFIIHGVKNRPKCTKVVSIYTHNMNPFGYWPEYRDLEWLFEDGRSLGNTDSPTTGHVFCPNQHCDIKLIPTDNKTLLAASDAIILNVTPVLSAPNASKISERLLITLPTERVKIVFYGMESPNMMVNWDSSIRDVYFHYSMTYHSSSDLFHPYGRYIPGYPMDDLDQSINYAAGKTRLLAWMASNCYFTFWPRREWVLQLKQFISIDIHGECGNVTCTPKLSRNCARMMRSYKFYLALENTQCDEYITEKFWDNGLLNGVVPVVYGGRRETYERLAPPGSFIFAADFASPKDLADYLIKLDNDNEQYNRFFAWRKRGRIVKTYPNLRPKAFCGLLPLLSKGDVEEVPIRRAGDTPYFRGCRDDEHARFIRPGDIDNWSPWK